MEDVPLLFEQNPADANVAASNAEARPSQQKVNLKVYMLESFESRIVNSRYSDSGKTSRFFSSALYNDTVITLSTYKEPFTKKINPKTAYKIMKATTNTMNQSLPDLKQDTIIMDTSIQLTEHQKAVIDSFYNLEIKTMQEASGIENYTRISVGQVKIKEIGPIVSFTKCTKRDIKVHHSGRSASLTLWKEMVSLGETINEDRTYNIFCIKPTNDFNGERCYSSTPSTRFTEVELQEEQVVEIEGTVDSASFDSNILEIDDEIYNISSQGMKVIFKNAVFKRGLTITGKRQGDTIVEVLEVKRRK